MSQTIRFDLDDLFDPVAYQNAADTLRGTVDKVKEPGWAALTMEAVRSRIGGEMQDALEGIELLDLFGEGWAKSAELLSFGDPAKHKPNVTYYVRLGHFEHDQDIDLQTTLSFVGLKTKPFTFTLSFTGEFNAIELAIRNGRIKRTLNGTCVLSAKLLADGKVLWPGTKLKKFAALGEHRFKSPGVALPGASRYEIPQPS